MDALTRSALSRRRADRGALASAHAFPTICLDRSLSDPVRYYPLRDWRTSDAKTARKESRGSDPKQKARARVVVWRDRFPVLCCDLRRLLRRGHGLPDARRAGTDGADRHSPDEWVKEFHGGLYQSCRSR